LPGRGRVVNQPVRVVVVERCWVTGGAGAVTAAVRRPDRGFGEVCGGVLVQPRCGSDLFTVGAAGSNLQVQVCAGASPTRPDIADVLACAHVISDRDVNAVLPHMRVAGGDGLPVDGVLDDDETAVAAGELGDGHRAVCG